MATTAPTTRHFLPLDGECVLIGFNVAFVEAGIQLRIRDCKRCRCKSPLGNGTQSHALRRPSHCVCRTHGHCAQALRLYELGAGLTRRQTFNAGLGFHQVGGACTAGSSPSKAGRAIKLWACRAATSVRHVRYAASTICQIKPCDMTIHSRRAARKRKVLIGSAADSFDGLCTLCHSDRWPRG